jgi:RNA polymerase sigma-70 factor, ECF subfamily
MEEHRFLERRFEAHRSHLRAVAYRMLGSAVEADDAVQEAWLRFSRSDTESVDNLGGWLTTVVARICLDELRARKSRREAPADEDRRSRRATRTRHSSAIPSARSCSPTRSGQPCSWC